MDPLCAGPETQHCSERDVTPTNPGAAMTLAPLRGGTVITCNAADHLSATGLPLAVQLISEGTGEATLLALEAELERLP
jgi:Asp-tRNA(Asn)/Glu-tRNA(Gln) amidotransferase A subunit family amidase